MSPRHFAKLMKPTKPSQAEIEYEQKVEEVIKHVVAVIAAPFKKIAKKD